MIKVVKDYKDMDFNKFFEIYKNISKKDLKDYYPRLGFEEGIKEYKIEYSDFIKEFLKSPNNSVVINIKEDIYFSAFRLITLNKEESEFYLEALETHNDYFNKGHATELISETLKLLSYDKKIKIGSAIKKTNIASLRTHEKCGFKIYKDYAVFEDEGIIKHKDSFTMRYSSN